MEIPLEELCNGHPHEFVEYLHHCRKLKYDEEPDYAKCLNLFQTCMKRHKFNPSIYDYTWTKKSPRKKIKVVKAMDNTGSKLKNLISSL